jgi:hypothetical protein
MVKPLPLNATFRRFMLRCIWIFVSRCEKFFHAIHRYYTIEMWIADRLRFPDGTLVSQLEHKCFSRSPWKIVRWSGDDYILQKPNGEAFDTDRGSKTEIYVWPELVKPLKDQPCLPKKK